MEQIKNVTLQSVDYFSEVLSSKTKKATKNEIQYKILNFLSEKGNQTFIDIYNETFSDKKFEEALRIFNEARKQGQTKVMAKISAAVKAAEQAGGAFGQWLAQKRKEQLERMYASDKKNRNTWDEDSMWYDPNAPKPEPKKPSWFSKTAGSAKDWLKGHFTRPKYDPEGYAWGGEAQKDFS